ncbi:MAG: FkbM family methyltransferase [Chitinophagaceae bacterium]
MLKKLTRPINKIFYSFGYNIVPNHTIIPRTDGKNWAELLNIQTIIDIGSNEGQFIKEINALLPGKKIFSFEPISSCYSKLLENTKGINVTAYNMGLSDVAGTAEINISNNFVSSSILEMAELHKSSYPESHFVKKDTIKLGKLDEILKNEELKENILIKMDVQGYEEKVILGGPKTFAKASALIIESIFEAFYEGQWLFDDLYQYFTQHGFKFMGFSDQVNSKKTGIPLYADSIFIKKELVPKIL